jgi:hypothetical protein
LATPFVQGRLREGEVLTFDIRSECAYSGRILQFEMDTALNCRPADSEARPLLFSPEIDWSQFKEPNIIHAY